MEKNPETKETVLELKPEDMEKVSGGETIPFSLPI